MELGNLMFGHSRGNWEVPSDDAYEQPIAELFEALSPGCAPYGVPHDNDVFTMNLYWWGEEDHPDADKPNFLHKRTGLELRWYKYALRDSYTNREVSPQEWRSIMDECIASVTKESDRE